MGLRLTVTAMQTLEVPDDAASTLSFAARIKELRIRFGGKQAWLACSIGCTDAAVSLWESGKRVPAFVTLHRIVEVLNAAGASMDELLVLRTHWFHAKRRKPHWISEPGQGPVVASRAR
jgi:transcriptional regulator with XRE-family HTH domain